MAAISKLKLVHENGKRITINASDYALDILGWQTKGWRIANEANVPMTAEEIDWLRREAQLNAERARERDAPRLEAQQHNPIIAPSDDLAEALRGTLAEAAAAVDVAGEATGPESQVSEAFRTMPWFKLRAECVKQGMDPAPASKAEAIAFLEERGLVRPATAE